MSDREIENENITDQLDLFVTDILIQVRRCEDKGFTTKQSIKIVQAAVESVKAEAVYHQKLFKLDKDDLFELLCMLCEK